MKKTILINLFAITIGSCAHAYDIPSANSKVEVEAPNLLKQMSEEVALIAKSAKKALVYISVSKTAKELPEGGMDPFEFFFGRKMPGGQQMPPQKQQGLGSGFIIDVEKGYILTNNHVVADADEIKLKLPNGETYSGKVLGRDPNTDIAVVQIDAKSFKKEGISALVLADSDTAKVGHFVVALGAPFSLEASLSFGVISAVERGSLHLTEFGNFIQTDAAINPGNSGGPLIDMNGKVVGINTAILSQSGGYNGVGFAIPSNIVRIVGTKLINNGKISRGFLGVSFKEYQKEWASRLNVPSKVKNGAIIIQLSDGPAKKSGLQMLDVIVSVDGQGLEKSDDLTRIIGLKEPGNKIKVIFYRDGHEKHLEVTIGDWPGNTELSDKNTESKEEAISNPYGLLVTPLDKIPEEKRASLKSTKGLFIERVMPMSPAGEAGFRPGDVILRVNTTPTDGMTEKQFYAKLKEVKDFALIHFEREGQFSFVEMKMN